MYTFKYYNTYFFIINRHELLLALFYILIFDDNGHIDDIPTELPPHTFIKKLNSFLAKF